MNAAAQLRVGNRRSVKLANVPKLPAAKLGPHFTAAVGDGWRLVTVFGMPEGADQLRLIAVLAHDARGQLAVTGALVSQRYPGFAAGCHQESQ